MDTLLIIFGLVVAFVLGFFACLACMNHFITVNGRIIIDHPNMQVMVDPEIPDVKEFQKYRFVMMKIEVINDEVPDEPDDY